MTSKIDEVTIYPSLYIENELNSVISQEKKKNILDKIKMLERDLEHYKKIHRRWKNADIIIRIIGHGSAVCICFVGSTLAFIGTFGSLLPGVLAVTGALDSIITEKIINGIMKQRKKRFTDKIKYVQFFIDKLHIFIMKADADNVLSLKEIEEYEHIIDEYNKVKDNIENKNNNGENFLSLKNELANLNERFAGISASISKSPV